MINIYEAILSIVGKPIGMNILYIYIYMKFIYDKYI
jgi:hypothetical protein